MLYESIYSGQKIDALLKAIETIKVIANGWYRLKSTETEPTSLATLINPGNFSTMYWTDGPTDVGFQAPLNIVVTKENDKVRQYLFSTGYNQDSYNRLYDPSTSTFDSWVRSDSSQKIHASDTKPTSPKDNEVWINTSGTGSPIQYYDATLKTFVAFTPYDYMDSNIYNPTSIEFVDVYTYIDNHLTTVVGVESAIDFDSHIKNAEIHISKTEKASYNKKETTDLLTENIQKITSSLSSYISNQIKESGVDVSVIQSEVKSIEDTLTKHINNTTIHPTKEQIANWNSKSDANHTHKSSDISISTSDIVGTLSINNIPEDAKERQVNVKTQDDILSLTKNDVQNGDFVYLMPDSGKKLLYIVVDQSKLGSMDAFLCLTTTPSSYDWSEIQDKPTTMSDLGITDSVSNSKIDQIISEANTTIQNINTEISEAEIALQECTTDRIRNSSKLETAIDSVDQKFYLAYNCIYGSNSILNTLENVIK